VHGSGGPRPSGGSRVHGGPQAAAAERLTGVRARGRSGEWKLAGGGGKGKGSLGGSYRGWGWAVRCRREAGDGGPKRRRLLLVDTKLGTEGNDEECGKGLWGRTGVLCGAFYRAREEGSGGGQGVTGGGSVEGSRRGVELVWGKRIWPSGEPLQLLTRTGGQPTAASGVVAPTKPKVARATEVGEDSRVGRSGLRRPAGQLGRCKVFGSGEEGKV
jgi:hypothetical protein